MNVSTKSLELLASELLHKSGLERGVADRCATVLVEADANGVSSHGVMRLPIYCTRLRSGAVDAQPDVHRVGGSAAFESWDGDNGFGIQVGLVGMDRAIELAKTYGIACVVMRRSNHFGPAGAYTALAAQQGLIGIAMTNVKPFMVAPEGRGPVVGNNPLAIGFPSSAGDGPNLDMALSVAAAGKISAAIKRGESIPDTWATDAQGVPTVDPVQAFTGFLQPMASYKGLGLAYAVDLLAGVLSGGSSQHDVLSMYEYPDLPSETGHAFIALDPTFVMTAEAWNTGLSDYRRSVERTPVRDGLPPHRLPGDVERQKAASSRVNGIDLPNRVAEELHELVDSLGLEWPWSHEPKGSTEHGS